MLLVLLLLSIAGYSQLPGSKSGFIKAKSLSIYYETTGKGTPVFLLHAGLQNNRMWDQQVPALAKTHQVITLDLPAHGKTTGWDTTFVMADILKAVMDSLKIAKASFVGLSFGAVCATDIALKYPDRVSKLVFVAPGLLGWDKFIIMDSVSKPKLDSLDAVFKRKDMNWQSETFTQTWCDGPFRKPDEVNKNVRNYIYNTTLENLRAHEDDYWPRFANAKAAENINSIKVPVLIIVGNKDIPLINNTCSFLKNNIRNARMITIPNVAHMLNMEQVLPFNKALTTFL